MADLCPLKADRAHSSSFGSGDLRSPAVGARSHTLRVSPAYHPPNLPRKSAQPSPEERMREIKCIGSEMMLSLPIALKANGIEYEETQFRRSSSILVKEADYERAMALIATVEETPLFEGGRRRIAIVIIIGALVMGLIGFLIWFTGDYR